jgi:multidrug resistance efflux pump
MIKLTKQTFLDVAEVIDAFRVVPRGVLIAYGILVWVVVSWFMGIPAPTTQQAALVTTVTGLIAAVAGLYQNSGRGWNKKE